MNKVIKLLLSVYRSVLATGLFYLLTGTLVLAAPIHDAVIAGDGEKIAMLVNTETDINVKDSSGMTALYLATMKENQEIVKALVENGADVNIPEARFQISPLHLAVRRENLEIVKFLIMSGADVNARIKKGTTPLHYAARTGHTEIVDVLIANGANVNSRDEEDYTPLHNSAFNGHMEPTRLLMANGADITATTYNGDTPLNCALVGNHAEVMALIETAIAAQ